MITTLLPQWATGAVTLALLGLRTLSTITQDGIWEFLDSSRHMLGPELWAQVRPRCLPHLSTHRTAHPIPRVASVVFAPLGRRTSFWSGCRGRAQGFRRPAHPERCSTRGRVPRPCVNAVPRGLMKAGPCSSRRRLRWRVTLIWERWTSAPGRRCWTFWRKTVTEPTALGASCYARAPPTTGVRTAGASGCCYGARPNFARSVFLARDDRVGEAISEE